MIAESTTGADTFDALDGRAWPFATLVDDAPDAIARIGLDGRIRYANRRLGHLFGREPDDFVGSAIGWVGLPPGLAMRYRRALRKALRDRAEVTFSFDAAVDGAERHYGVRIVPEFDGDRIVAALAITRDRTERFAVERERDALLAKAEAARRKVAHTTRARDQFLSIISHELRSPLNGIQSWSHVLENQLGGPDHANPVAMRALEGIRAGIEQQVKLIEHLVDATVSMSGTLELVVAPLVLREPLEAAIAEVRPNAIGKDIALHVDLRLTDERMHGDARRVRQVFGHLLSNALKFTPHGGSIWISARRQEAGAAIAVRDSGRGLAPGFATWLFEPFGQADSSNTRRSGGLGLGLALSRRLVELHGGRIEAESPGPHLGSTFRVWLPLEERRLVPRMAPSDKPAAGPALAGLRTLVVDDQVEAREALCALLTQFGADVDVAPGSREAMAQIVADGAPDVVVCDIAMPEEDGYGFVKRLRDHEHDRASLGDGASPGTPVIALSAFAATDRRGLSGPDFDAYLTKPVDPPQLLATLLRLVSTGRRAAPPR